MATLSVTNPTLADVAKRLDPNGKIDAIVEMLSQTNEILADMTWIEGNLPTGHRHTIRTGLPEPTWRKLYGGVSPTKSTTAQVTDNCGMLEAYAEVDKALADLNGNTAAFRMSEDRAHVEGINQKMAYSIFYENEGTTPEAITGLTPRFKESTADNSDSVIKAGGASTDNTSVWLVVWSPETCHGIYPKGSIGGLQQRDLGEVTADASGGGLFQAYRTHYRWDAGMTVRDWRYVVRICNIDVSDLNGLSSTQAITASTSILKLMITAIERIPNLGMGRAAFYMNRTVRTMLRHAMIDKIANNLSFETLAGRSVLAFDGIPVRRVDKIANNETLVA